MCRGQFILWSNFENVFGNTIQLADNPRTALKGADCAILMTEWNQFRKLKANDYIAYMTAPALVDARRVYDPSEFTELKFVAVGLGS